MDAGLAVKGLVFGFSIAASVGPIWLLCMRRTLSAGPLVGLASGLGVATADGTYAALAAFGMSVVTSTLVEWQLWMRLVGGAILLCLGFSTARAGVPGSVVQVSARGIAGAYASTLGLTLTNPLTIVSFLGIFAGLGIGAGAGGRRDAATLVLGVFLGSALWWVVMATTVTLVKERLSTRVLRGLNVSTGAVIAAFGILAMASALVS